MSNSKLQFHTAGLPLEEAQAAMVMIHGRGASAHDILSLVAEFNVSGFTYLAPQAPGYTWYPQSFLAPIEANEPSLSASLQTIGTVLEHIKQAGIPEEKTILLGFSQGACLSLEFAARNTRYYGGVIALSGGLIGPDERLRSYTGSLEKTPIFLGCSDIDMHIPLTRVQKSTRILHELGAAVTEQIYPGMGHTINQDELNFVQKMMTAILA